MTPTPTSAPMRCDFTGRRVVVTGASRGIGAAVATAFAASGAEVVCVQRGTRLGPELVEAARDGGGSVEAIAADLGDREAVPGLIAEVLAGGPVDVLVNNAGMTRWHDSVDFPLEDFDAILDVNVRSVFQLCQGFGRGMLDRGAGKIVNIASMTSFIGGYRSPAYVSSKGAVAQLTKALCNEWAPRGVNVNAIAPGYFDTQLNTPLKDDATRSAEILMRIPAGYWGDPRAIGDAALFLASAQADYIHGIVLPVDGGWLAR